MVFDTCIQRGVTGAPQVFRWLRAAAEQGHADAQVKIFVKVDSIGCFAAYFMTFFGLFSQ